MSLLLSLLTLLPSPASCPQDPHQVHRAPFTPGIERIWVGPDFFANRLGDWKLVDGEVRCIEAGARTGLRTLHWLTLCTGPGAGSLLASVRVTPPGEGEWIEGAMAGLLVGAGGEHVDPRLTAMVHSLPAEDGGLLAVIDAAGRVSLRDHSQESGKGGNWSVSAEVTDDLLPLLPDQELLGEGFGADGAQAVELLLSLGPDAD